MMRGNLVNVGSVLTVGYREHRPEPPGGRAGEHPDIQRPAPFRSCHRGGMLRPDIDRSKPNRWPRELLDKPDRAGLSMPPIERNLQPVMGDSGPNRLLPGVGQNR